MKTRRRCVRLKPGAVLSAAALMLAFLPAPAGASTEPAGALPAGTASTSAGDPWTADLWTVDAWTVHSEPGTQVVRSETGGISFSAPPVAGKLAGGLVVPGEPTRPAAAVEATVVIAGGTAWDQRNEVWLAALLPARGGPGGAALVWRRSQRGFFPRWELILYPDPGPFERFGEGGAALSGLPPGGFELNGDATVLTTTTPEPGHTYRASLSIDRTTGDVHVSLVNLTQGRAVYQGTVHLKPQGVDLVPAAGGFAQCRRCGDEWRITFEFVSYSPGFVPFASSWRLLRETSAGPQPVVTTYVERLEPLYVEVTLPGRPALGASAIVARTGDQSTTLVDLTGMTGKHTIPVSLAAIEHGELTLALQYESPEGRWELSSHTFQLISGVLDLQVITDRLVGHDWTAILIVETALSSAARSAPPSPASLTGRLGASAELSLPLELSLEATVLIPKTGSKTEWETVSEHRITFPDLDLSEGTVALPVRLPLNVPEPAVVQIALSPATNTPGYRLTLTPKEVDFLAVPRTPAASKPRSYSFDGSISHEVLTNYLSRAITMLGFADPDNKEILDDLRFIANTGAKFIGRAAYVWNAPADDDVHFQAAERAAKLAHDMDPELILQACIFEAVYEGIERIPIPAWVFEEFGLPVEERTFDYEAMLFDDGTFVDHWGPGGSVPDMTKLETKMWFFYRAKRYIDAGYEAIHFGQVHLMGRNDPGFRHWRELLERIRAYARKHARRHMLLADAHTHGIVIDGDLLFDFHSYPLRIAEVPGKPLEGQLVKGRIDSIYGRSRSGVTPSGWYADPLPYLVEVDNWGSSGRGGVSINEWWVWGYDEISWFARQDEAYRNQWLRYAWHWVRETDPAGYLQMPAKRVLHDPVNGVYTYRAHTPSPANPHGFNQEETIKAIWAEDE